MISRSSIFRKNQKLNTKQTKQMEQKEKRVKEKPYTGFKNKQKEEER